MAQAVINRMKKGARRFAKQTRVFTRLLGRDFKARRETIVLILTGLMTSVTNHPSMRRSRLHRESVRLWRRFILLLSGEYNFEDFYRTQYGLGMSLDQVSPTDYSRLPSAVLLEKAYDLSDDVQGIAAMRVLVERAVLRAMARDTLGRAVAAYEPKPHDPSIHHQWRDAIEVAFAPRRQAVRSAATLPVFIPERPAKTGKVAELPLWKRDMPLMVADDEAFELSVPEAVAYRASTRH